ncbi:MAG TPA: glycosyltransferase family 4 protein [Mycobacteriales bacterium]|nr:glycosyltransferase family 4 protein [Mycobacteriales bacterium]
MRIVYLHQYFNTPDMAGSTRSYEMATSWAAAGHEVHVITSARKPAGRVRRGWRAECIDGITVHWRSVPYGNEMGFVQRVRAFLTFAALAGPRARSIRPDAVFATSTPLTIILPALVATALRRSRLVFEVRDLWPQLPIATGHLRHPLLIRAAQLLETLAYRSSRMIVALSPGMAEGVIARGTPEQKVVVAPNACDTHMFTVPPAVGLRYRRGHPQLGTGPLIAYCGTLGEINGVSYLVRLAAIMRRIHPDAVFGIYGTGKDEPEVRALARRLGVLDANLFMMGAVPKREIVEVLSAAAVAVSLFRPIPEMEMNSANKFFDALAAGRPVAINYGGWQAELIRQTGCGVVLHPGDIETAAEELNSFLQSNTLQERAREAARRLATGPFARSRITETVLDTITGPTDRNSGLRQPSAVSR